MMATADRGQPNARLDIRNLPRAPALIEALPVGLVCHPDLPALAARLAQLLAGRAWALTPGHAAIAGFDTFPKLTVWALAATPGEAGRAWLACAYLGGAPGADPDQSLARAALDAALRAAVAGTPAPEPLNA